MELFNRFMSLQERESQFNPQQLTLWKTEFHLVHEVVVQSVKGLRLRRMSKEFSLSFQFQEGIK